MWDTWNRTSKDILLPSPSHPKTRAYKAAIFSDSQGLKEIAESALLPVYAGKTSPFADLAALEESNGLAHCKESLPQTQSMESSESSHSFQACQDQGCLGFSMPINTNTIKILLKSPIFFILENVMRDEWLLYYSGYFCNFWLEWYYFQK